MIVALAVEAVFYANLYEFLTFLVACEASWIAVTSVRCAVVSMKMGYSSKTARFFYVDDVGVASKLVLLLSR